MARRQLSTGWLPLIVCLLVSLLFLWGITFRDAHLAALIGDRRIEFAVGYWYNRILLILGFGGGWVCIRDNVRSDSFGSLLCGFVCLGVGLIMLFALLFLPEEAPFLM